ncbi:hypothetical protein WKR88_15130 [Trinickia caryophylli]|uniref:Uncharacterized protein n=1 Tax=Trinickia caryophylli TaxID=28094 RepID=A0A1X7D6Z2_TRICW|nr:hypothetical protein [Trinickia caryophylli]PMS12676.1 ATP-dependent helicase HrpA [Trinickia caryophylli]TRX15082.1 ATP-dependent helicase HrpA [Trinickia caryophylli]WQE14941.1 hypothetical protein U0034_20525 [Trinickia caryophylli]SMF09822.1 hypothetical protein SAMN06295900_102457 [Trinickia caryophylli]GLU31330.1 hypothetical protein Busp01_11720 [Trinickia caryophylli]
MSLSRGISGGSTASNVLSTGSTIAEMQANTAASIALQDAATKMENELNNDAAKDQLAEAGPKNAKSLTQG